MPKVCPHSLRGLHFTIAMERGATSGVLAAALGHGSFQITAKHYAAPGTMDRVRSRVVEETLRAAMSEEVDGDMSEADPADLRRALERLPEPIRQALRRGLGEPSKP